MRFLVGKHKIEGNFQSGGSLGWNYGTEPKEVLINKVFYLGHYKNIKKIGKTINPILETVKLRTSKHSTRDYKHSANVIQKWEQNDLTNSGNLSKLL